MDLMAHADIVEWLGAKGLAFSPHRLYANLRRRGGLAAAETAPDGRKLYRREDVERWYEKTYRGASRIDLGRTTLGRWLRDHDQTAPRFARQLGLASHTIYKFLGHSNTALRAGMNINSQTLELISLTTDIAQSTLIEDAQRAGNGAA